MAQRAVELTRLAAKETAVEAAAGQTPTTWYAYPLRLCLTLAFLRA